MALHRPRRRLRRSLPAATALLAGLALGAFLALAPITSLPDGTAASAVAAGNAFLLGIAALVVGFDACAFVGVVRGRARFAWGGVAGIGLLGVVPFALVPQVWIVGALAAAGVLLGTAADAERTRLRVVVALGAAAATVPLFALTYLTAPDYRVAVAAIAVAALGAVGLQAVSLSGRTANGAAESD
ncbi:MAG: hypothetical protein ABEJ74_05960 [Haloferacaceae archaeon]